MLRLKKSALSAWAAAALLVGCTGATGSVAPPSATASPSAAESAGPGETASPSGVPETMAPNAAPPDLAGTWRRNLRGEEILLTLQDNGYNIRRSGEMGSGAISVDGDRVEFSGSQLCGGVGAYTWSLEDRRLRLTEIDDPCSGRSEALILGTFGRVEP